MQKSDKHPWEQAICPKCEGLCYYNSYFQAAICPYCGWQSESKLAAPSLEELAEAVHNLQEQLKKIESLK
jgi:hypothetical protein